MCEKNQKVMHFSFDDTYLCLWDLITNADKYDSIFDNAFLEDIKTIHRETGAVFSLYCFNKVSFEPEYNISALPDKFCKEFTENKSWLRFGFHAEDNNSRYITTGGILKSYNKFTETVYHMTGDYECIDRIVRLGFFSGSRENIIQIQEADHGITGLLAADDERKSYYFDSIQNDIVIERGQYEDTENGLIFFRSLKRLDNNDETVVIGQLRENPGYQRCAEIFMHEPCWTGEHASRIRKLAVWGNDNGFVHAFPCDMYKRKK